MFILLCLHTSAIPPTLCEAERLGLVLYPTTLAPVSGSVTVTTQCADNAHKISSSLSVSCTSSGTWIGIPQCECVAGYQVIVDDRGMEICQG